MIREDAMEQGYVHVYTGNGKGKTTAALGLAMRAAGAGRRVFIAQFAKGRESSEQLAFGRLSDRVVFRQFGAPAFVRGIPGQNDRQLADDGLQQTRAALLSGEYGMVILDEAGIAVMLGLVSVDSLLELIDARPPHVEVIITGRGVDERILSRADLVTEMLEVKHYYRRGILGRVGIEM
jgi:cob(I)alamin adenosyltransferase